jgi:hypothetical protein
MGDAASAADLLGLRDASGPGLEFDPSHPINRGLDGWWPFDQSGGTVVRDISGKRNHGTLVNSNNTATSGWGSNRLGRVINFDGTDDHVNVGPNVIRQTGSFTVSCWFQYTTADRAILGRGLDAFPDAWSMTTRTTSGNKLDCFVVTTSGGVAAYGFVGATTLVTGQIYHLVVEYHEANTLKAWLNNREEGSASLAGTSVLRTTTSDVFFGRGENGGGALRHYAGSIANARVFARRLASSERAALYAERSIGRVDLDAPLYFAVGGSAPIVHDLVANSIVSAATVGTPALGQTHVLAATSIASAATVGTPALGQRHVLAATSIASAATVGTPALGQRHVLAATSIASAATVGTPALGQTHVLAATSIASAATVGTPALNAAVAVVPAFRTYTLPAAARRHTLAADLRSYRLRAAPRRYTAPPEA